MKLKELLQEKELIMIRVSIFPSQFKQNLRRLDYE